LIGIAAHKEPADIRNFPLAVVLFQDAGFPADPRHVRVQFTRIQAILIERYPGYIPSCAKIEILPTHLCHCGIRLGIGGQVCLDPGTDRVPFPLTHDAATRPPTHDPAALGVHPILRPRLIILVPDGHRFTVSNLERSLAADKPRALIQMATGSGKTFTAVSFVDRLIKHANARRVLSLVDRSNLGRQTLRELQQYVTPDDGRKFTELYNV
jgi:hypothetical protein